jgi:hypothetical protein
MEDEGKLEDAIRHRAYQIWEAEGGAHGGSADWAPAEGQATRPPSAPSNRAARTKSGASRRASGAAGTTSAASKSRPRTAAQASARPASKAKPKRR